MAEDPLSYEEDLAKKFGLFTDLGENVAGAKAWIAKINDLNRQAASGDDDADHQYMKQVGQAMPALEDLVGAVGDLYRAVGLGGTNAKLTFDAHEGDATDHANSLHD